MTGTYPALCLGNAWSGANRTEDTWKLQNCSFGEIGVLGRHESWVVFDVAVLGILNLEQSLAKFRRRVLLTNMPSKQLGCSLMLDNTMLELLISN